MQERVLVTPWEEAEPVMKCQHCEKPATFHITELTEANGPSVLHLCEDHAREYLSGGEAPNEAPSSLTGMLAKQLKLDQTAEQLAELDQKACPMCGIQFSDFRQTGRLGCPYDYVFFESDLEPLLVSIHGSKVHKGKHPSRAVVPPDQQHKLIQLRKEMKAAIDKEDYENAGRLRDEIKKIEKEIS
ncbi:MAG: UvrB/UvrC motif-containing protein [Pirellulales bacterium]